MILVPFSSCCSCSFRSKKGSNVLFPGALPLASAGVGGYYNFPDLRHVLKDPSCTGPVLNIWVWSSPWWTFCILERDPFRAFCLASGGQPILTGVPLIWFQQFIWQWFSLTRLTTGWWFLSLSLSFSLSFCPLCNVVFPTPLFFLLRCFSYSASFVGFRLEVTSCVHSEVTTSHRSRPTHLCSSRCC